MRVNKDEVKLIIDTGLGDTQIESFITIANTMVDEYLSGSGLSTAILKEIERWLTAHLIATGRERQLKSEKVADLSIAYTGNYGKFLESTSYGQQVLALDTTGTLVGLGKTKARLRSINPNRT